MSRVAETLSDNPSIFSLLLCAPLSLLATRAAASSEVHVQPGLVFGRRR